MEAAGSQVALRRGGSIAVNRSTYRLVLVICAAALSAVISAPSTASVLSIGDHSLPKAQVKIYHVKCSDGRFAIVKVDNSAPDRQVCGFSQDGHTQPQCVALTADAIRAQAERMCRP